MSNHEAEALNVTEALERVEGDIELLKELAELFLQECPRMLAEIEHAIAAGDPQALQHAAHTLKGSVSNFAASRAAEASLVLEKMGRQQNLVGAAAAFSTLQHELTRVNPALETLRKQEAA